MSAFYTDTLAQSVGTTLAGTTASDGVSVYTALVGNMTASGTGTCYPTSGNASLYVSGPSGSVPTHSDYDIDFSISPKSFINNSGVIWVAAHQSTAGTASAAASIWVRFTHSNATTLGVIIQQQTGYGGIKTSVTGTNQAIVSGSTYAYRISVRGNVVTVTAQPSGTVIATLTITWLFDKGYVSFGGTNNGQTATTGLHLAGTISATQYAGTPTSCILTQPIRNSIYPASDGNEAVMAPFFQEGYNNNNPNVGYNIPQYAFFHQFTLSLNGGTLATDLHWTPPASLTLASGPNVSAGKVVLPAGSTFVRFDAYLPLGTASGSLTLAGTNDQSLSNAGCTVTVRPNLLLAVGDSHVDGEYLGNYLSRSSVYSLADSWHVVYMGYQGQTLSQVNTWISSLVAPWLTSSRAGKCYVVHDAGTNDIEGGSDAATTFAAIQTNIAALQAALPGVPILLAPILSRNSSRTRPTFWGIASSVNASMVAAYGPTGTDRSVQVLRWDLDPQVCSQDACLSTQFFSDGIHVSATTGFPLLAGYLDAAVRNYPTLSATTTTATYWIEG